jgi:hypothetical protein
MEHRWGDRLQIDIPIRMTGDRASQLHTGRLTNISLSGALITTAFAPRVLSRIQASWSSSPRPAHYFPAVAAYIVRKSEDGIAVEWCEFAPTAVAQIMLAAASDHLGPADWPPWFAAIPA